MELPVGEPPPGAGRLPTLVSRPRQRGATRVVPLPRMTMTCWPGVNVMSAPCTTARVRPLSSLTTTSTPVWLPILLAEGADHRGDGAAASASDGVAEHAAEHAAGAGTDEFLAGVFIVDADMAE